MKILVGICGSVSAYKSIEFTRGLIKKGHQVTVILTSGAQKFVKSELYSYLGAHKVYTSLEDFEQSATQGQVLHVELAKWADELHIYPASANTIANLAMGKCDDLLTSVFLAGWDRFKTVIYPAMNTSMWTNPLTKENIDLLERLNKQSNIFIYPPQSGVLACGDIGEGKIPDVEEVLSNFDAINTSITSNSQMVLITTGATIAPIDPVRYVTNPSSGKTGYLLAKESLRLGYQTTLICGQISCPEIKYLSELPGMTIIKTRTTDEMYERVHEEIENSHIYISSAAISDIKFETANHKLKKSELSTSLPFTSAVDILKSVIEKYSNKKVVGFAAETDLTESILLEKFKRKPVDLLIGTHVNNGLSSVERMGFGNDSASYSFMENERISFSGELSKEQLAQEIFKRIKS